MSIKIYQDGRMPPESASAYLGLSVKTLAQYRSQGVGPLFAKIGRRIFYFQADLDQFVQEQGKFVSTTQARLMSKGV